MIDEQPIAEVGLDDLFGQQGGPQRPVGGSLTSPGARWLVGRVFFAVAGAIVLYGALYVMRLTVPFPLLVVTIFVVTLVKYILGGVSAPPLPRQVTGRGLRPMDPSATAGGADEDPHDGVAVAVGRWTTRLGWLGEGRKGREAQPAWLGDLVDGRLRVRYGFTRDSDPRRAREMMGEHLWRMLQDPLAGSRSPADMAVLVKRIEEL
jgi:hypothetical protein